MSKKYVKGKQHTKRIVSHYNKECNDWIRESERSIEKIFSKARRGKWHPLIVRGDIQKELSMTARQCFRFGGAAAKQVCKRHKLRGRR